MEYLIFILIGVLFLFGAEKSIGFARLLEDRDLRRNFVIRVAGFFAMSAWIHSLPFIMLTIYMREHRMIAPELFTFDAARTTLVGLYVMPIILISAAVLSVGAFFRWIDESEKYSFRAATVLGVVLYSLAMWAVWRGENRELFWLILIVSLVVAVYIWLALLCSFETHLKLHFIPFLAISIITGTMFFYSTATEALVAQELKSFSSGGGDAAVVQRGGVTYSGKLVLLTKDTIYLELKPTSDEFANVQCLLRLPAADSELATNLLGDIFLGKDVTPISRCSPKLLN